MGVDVQLYAIGEVTDAQLEVACAYMDAHVGHMCIEFAPILRRGLYQHERIVFHTSSRFYGRHGGKGDWPSIYASIIALIACLPQCLVYYGSDLAPNGEPCTPELLTEIWTWWCRP